MFPKTAEVTQQLMKAMMAHPLFEHLSDTLLQQCISAMNEKAFDAGNEVIREGDAGHEFYVSFSGSFEAYRGAESSRGSSSSGLFTSKGEDSGELLLQRYDHGEIFGELALLYNAPRACSVRATTDATAYALDRVSFRQLVMQHNSGLKHGLETYLRTVPILADLHEDEISRLADVINLSEFEDGEYIVEVGAKADTLYLILSGEVVCHRDGGEKELLRLAQGDFFGESAISEKEEDRQRLANVVAVGKVRVGALKADDFMQVVGTLTDAMKRGLTRKAIDSVEMLRSSLTTIEMDELQRELRDETYEADVTVINQGELGTKFYIIRSGSVDVIVDGVKINMLALGGVFGERSLLTAEPTIASVKTRQPTTLMSLDKAAFERVLPPLKDLMARSIAEREAQAARAARAKIRFTDLKTVAVLGEGSFGRVRLMQWQHGGEKHAYALKCLQKGQLVCYKQIDHVINEKRVLEMCHHPFILKLEGVFNTKNQVFMLLEVALGGELFSHLRGEGKFEPAKGALYAAMVCSAFSYMHARKIAHRDLKPENLIFDTQGYLKLVDFGFAKVIKDRTWTLCGTPEYLAPEIISNQGHNCGVDWWTLGILTYEMLVGRPPFQGETQLDTYQRIVKGRYKMPANLEPQVKDFVARLLMLNNAVRLGCSWGGPAEVVGHPFFEKINFRELEAKSLPMPYVPCIQDAFDTSNFFVDAYSDDDGAAEWVKFNSSQYEPIWKAEFERE